MALRLPRNIALLILSPPLQPKADDTSQSHGVVVLTRRICPSHFIKLPLRREVALNAISMTNKAFKIFRARLNSSLQGTIISLKILTDMEALQADLLTAQTKQVKRLKTAI